MLNARAVQALKIIALIASSNPSQAVNSKQLSLQLGLSVSYIESLLKILKKNELVAANRGPGGGYLLQKCVNEISVWDVVTCFETQADPSVETRTREYASSQATGLGAHSEDLALAACGGFSKAELIDAGLDPVKPERSRGSLVLRPRADQSPGATAHHPHRF